MTDTSRFCINCKHFSDKMNHTDLVSKCLVAYRCDPVYGTKTYYSCYTARSFYGECGPSASRYTPNETV